MWLELTAIVIIFFIIFIHLILPKKYFGPSTHKKLNKFPGPPGVPFFGNAFDFAVGNDEFIPLMIRLMDQYKPIWKMSILGAPFVFLSEVDDIEVLLTSRTNISKGVDYQFLLPWLGNGLLVSTGKKWFNNRKLLTPAFHFTILEQYVDIMNSNAQILCNILGSYSGEIEVNPLIRDCTLDIICETAMGTKVNAQLEGESEYIKNIGKMSDIFMQRILAPWFYRDIIFNLSPLGREQKKALKVVHGFTKKVIKERKQAYEEKVISGKTGESESLGVEEKKKMSFLDLLIEISETQNRLTEEEIREEVDTFMFEGHDTTAASTVWTLFELSLNPEIQEKVYEEQCEIFQESDRHPTYQDIQEMKYLERVIKETLRLYPSVPIVSRILEEDVKIRDHVIPAETQVPIFIYYIHRDPKLFPEPNKFNPDRFLPEISRKRHPYSYIPFSAGPRNCIGQKFAMTEEKIILSHIIRKYKVRTSNKREDLKLVSEIILRTTENFKMTFIKR